jgi:malate dehydrogenase (oxaloacetate-decarboxylating)(NADP+)
MARVLENLRRKEHDIERYIFLIALQARNERLFHRTLIEHIDELMPLVYTPTVGQACREFAHIFRQPRGFYVTPSDRGRIRANLANWPERDVRVIVITDGERILGLGDLGANGMGIPIGKLSLYSACAGIPPSMGMPVQFDVGTENEALRSDPLYLGVPKPRLRGEAYYELMDEFVDAVQDAYPRALIQFEDFLTPTAYELLGRYRDRILCFNDDIQGTAAVALAGVYAAARAAGKSFADLRVMFLGAGSASTGIADLMTSAFVTRGLTLEEARARLWLVNRKGLVVRDQPRLASYQTPYAHDHAPLGFVDAIRSIRPDVLIGATGQPGTFTEEVV